MNYSRNPVLLKRVVIGVCLTVALAGTWIQVARARAVDTIIDVNVASTLSAVLDLAFPTSRTDSNTRFLWATGTGANQADKLFSDTRTLTASANEDIDLQGSLVDGLNQTVTFARVKAIIIKAAAANTNSVQVTRPAANGVPLFLAAGDGLALRPGAEFVWISPDATGVAVTAGTADLINIANSAAGTSVTYDIIIIGASI